MSEKAVRKSGTRHITVPGVVNVRVQYDRIGIVSSTVIDIGPSGEPAIVELPATDELVCRVDESGGGE